jgi:small subunit ribosomal protein S1
MPQTIQKKNSPELQVLKLDPSLMPLLKEGDLVGVKLVERSNRAVYFDILKIGTGIIYGIELINAKDILKKLKIGDSVTAKVVEAENANGLVELSLAEADKQKSWQDVKDLKDGGEPIKVTVKDANAGGLITELCGLQAFLPASQLSNEHYPKSIDGNRGKILEELQKFIDKEFTVKIIGINPRTNKLIISEREVIAENVKELLEKYSVGDTISGIVAGVANFGVFVRFADHPEIEGLIHISELTHNIIDHPKEVVGIGDMITAQITEIKDGRVSLSLKALQLNPWEKVQEKFIEGSTVSGVVHKLNPFGAFVRLDSNITGLIHVSEFGSIDELKKHLQPDTTHKFLISSINPEEKRIVLKLAKPLSKPEKKDKSKSIQAGPEVVESQHQNDGFAETGETDTKNTEETA